MIGSSAPARQVQLWDEDILLRTVPVNVARPDVAAAHPRAPEQTGFWTQVGTLGLAREFAIDLRGILEDGTEVELGSVRGRRSPIASAATRFSPVLLTSLGRTGTTLLMSVLSAHPEIVADRTYPYEVFPARYWLHLLRVLAEPADGEPASGRVLAHELSSVGPNPFNTAPLTNDPALAELFGRRYVERLARFSLESIDDFYETLATAQGKPAARYFVEKVQPDHVPRIARDLYPCARQIFLVRDFRDLICSVFAFNEKRRTVEFGRERVQTDEEYVGWIAMGAHWLVNAWKSQRESSVLVRYEDLVTRPAETLERVLAFVGVARGPSLVEELLREAFEHPELGGHRTSRTAEESIGRWRRELPRRLRRVVEQQLHPPLVELGYELC